MRTHRVHNRTIGNLTVRSDPSVRTAASDESGWPLSEQSEQRLRLPRSSGRSRVRRSEGERLYPRERRAQLENFDWAEELERRRRATNSRHR